MGAIMHINVPLSNAIISRFRCVALGEPINLSHTHTHIERQTDRQTHIHVSETYKSIHKSCHFQHDCSTRVQSCIGHEDVVCASGTSCCTSHRINIYLYNKLIRIGL